MSPSSTDVRYRCEACGNLTRFEVTATRTTRSFHHYTVGGELTIEDQDVVAETIESVVCRWCGSGDSVVEISDADELISAGAERSDAVDGGPGMTDGRTGSSDGAV